MRGLESGSEGWIIGFGTGVVLTLIFVGPLGCGGDGSGGDDPMDEADEKREEAWVDEYDGDPGTENETTILDEDWCRDHLHMERAQAELEDRANLQEATGEATP